MMNKVIASICLFVMYSMVNLVKADTLTLQQAMIYALENNHGLQVAKIQSEIADNLATPGNAGLYPKITLNGGANYSNQNSTILFNGNIPKNEVKGAISNSYNSSVAMSYVLFDGLGVVYNYRKLQSQAEKSDLQWKLTIENTLIQVINTYLEIVRWQNTVQTQQFAVAISSERVLRAERGLSLGSKTGLDVLNARVDLTNDSINLSNAMFQLDNLKRSLNWAMGRDVQTGFNAVKPITTEAVPSVESLLSESLKNNNNYIISQLNGEIAQLDYSIANSKRFPVLTGNMSYGINHAKNGAGIVLSSDVTGFSTGLTLNYNLFDGLKVKTQIDNAALMIESNESLKKESEKTIARDVYNAWNGYQFSVGQKGSEENYLNLATQALKRTEEANRNGQATSLEFRQAQLNVLNAQTRQFNSDLAILKYYYELKRLNGSLLKG